MTLIIIEWLAHRPTVVGTKIAIHPMSAAKLADITTLHRRGILVRVLEGGGR